MAQTKRFWDVGKGQDQIQHITEPGPDSDL